MVNRDIVRHSLPVKVTVTFCQGEGKPYILRWIDVHTGEYRRKSTGTKDLKKAESMAENKRRELGLELLNSNLDTYEKRIRKYYRARTEFSKKKALKNDPKEENYISPSKAAQIEAKIAPSTAKKGMAVLDKVDELKASGNLQEAEDLMIMLNQSPAKAFDYIGGKYSGTRSSIRRFITRSITNIAQKIDELARDSAQDEHRNECIILLKQLSAKLDEWRASE